MSRAGLIDRPVLDGVMVADGQKDATSVEVSRRNRADTVIGRGQSLLSTTN